MIERHREARLAARLARTSDAQTLTDIILETFRLNGRLLEKGDGMTRDLGLSSARWQVLAAVDGEPLTVAEIARRMGLRRQSVQRTVNSLKSDAFVVLTTNPNHRRAKLVELSDKGFTALEEVYRRHNVWAEDFVRGLTSEELKTTFATMAEIRQRLERAGN